MFHCLTKDLYCSLLNDVQRGLVSETFVHLCCSYAQFEPLCIYSEVHCVLACVLCILSPRLELIVTDVKLREKRSRRAYHIQAGHGGQKAQSGTVLWGCVDYNGTLLHT